jgi:hypothetical protein
MFRWVREYHYEARPDDTVQDTMMFFFSDGQVRGAGRGRA